MHMLVHLCWLFCCRFEFLLFRSALESSSIGLGLCLRRVIILIDITFLGLLYMIMFLRQYLRVFERLNCSVVMVLMSFFLDESLLPSFVRFCNMCVLDRRRDFRVDCCIYITVGGRGYGGIGWIVCNIVGRSVCDIVTLGLCRSGTLRKELIYCIDGIVHNVDWFRIRKR